MPFETASSSARDRCVDECGQKATEQGARAEFREVAAWSTVIVH
jgi:hypothetical protein